MSQTAAALPDIVRPDVGVIMLSDWQVGNIDRQRAAADALVEAYESLDDMEGLRSLTCFVSPDDDRLLTYAQWADESAFESFMRDHGSALDTAVANVAPDSDRPPAIKYELYRSYTPEVGDAQADWMVGVTFRYAGPDYVRPWVDVVIDAIRDVEPVKGLVVNHFHVADDAGDDESRMFNYTLWTDKESHVAAIEGADGPIGKDGPVGQRVRTMPGVVGGGFVRYQLYRSVQVPARTA
jgi:hypothetical protein